MSNPLESEVKTNPQGDPITSAEPEQKTNPQGDPITSARIEAINEAGGNAFAEYQIPLAILALQQGLGRLIRHRQDRGVLAILDPRLRTMGYGRRFLASLPPAPVTHDLDRIDKFFDA